jgi:hypothetical protein
MREVSVSRFVQTQPPVLEEALSPAAILEAEGSFSVRDIESDGDRVTVGGYGLELVFEFSDRQDGIEYDQLEGPLETLRTTLTYEREDEGTRLTARSDVAVGGPGLLDRLAAWKRRGELRRALDTLTAEYR